jgi:hypothetical protein
MQVAEDFDGVETALPRAGHALRNLGDVPTFHDRYGARHPLALYNVSLSTVATKLLKVLEALSEAKGLVQLQPAKHDGADQYTALLEATDNLLDALMEHFDDCGRIVKSFFPSLKDNRFKNHYGEYGKSIEPYRDHVGAIDNCLKHRQGRLRPVAFAWPGGSRLGYFVEGCIDGRLGPALDVHPTGKTAFSYNRDIPLHVCGVFFVGACLAETLCSIDRRIAALPSHQTEARPESDWSKALKVVSALPHVFFPDEVQQSVPLVRVEGGRLHVEFPSADTNVYGPPNGSTVRVAFRGDGVTKALKIPYWKGHAHL